tara:strand:+ start:179 stop:775 length:597 start_codon:yes stop_codon:yes gene_type:complete
MNTLAHLYLSGNDPDLILGNFIGDSVRGGEFSQLDERVQEGVRLHRKIDRFTDQHPIFRQISSLMRGDFGRYCTVVADVFLDHFLARDWERFDARSLEDYTRWIHQILAERIDTCPERSRRYFKYLSATDTLLHYRSTEGISRTLLQMAKRARFNSGMENAGAVLRRQYPQLKEGFESFFPELVRYTLGERRAHATSA